MSDCHQDDETRDQLKACFGLSGPWQSLKAKSLHGTVSCSTSRLWFRKTLRTLCGTSYLIGKAEKQNHMRRQHLQYKKRYWTTTRYHSQTSTSWNTAYSRISGESGNAPPAKGHNQHWNKRRSKMSSIYPFLLQRRTVEIRLNLEFKSLSKSPANE